MTLPEKADPAILSAAFVLVFRQGRSPPSCPAPDDAGLLNRIRDAVPSASDAACRDALMRVRRLSFDALEAGSEYLSGGFGKGDEAKRKAESVLEEQNPGFTKPEYSTAFAVGMMWASL